MKNLEISRAFDDGRIYWSETQYSHYGFTKLRTVFISTLWWKWIYGWKPDTLIGRVSDQYDTFCWPITRAYYHHSVGLGWW